MERWTACGQCKTAKVLLAVEATRRWAGDGITANALMPGAIRTNLQRYVEDDEATRRRWAESERDGSLFWKSTAQGAATSALLATAPQLEGIGGPHSPAPNNPPPPPHPHPPLPPAHPPPPLL